MERGVSLVVDVPDHVRWQILPMSSPWRDGTPSRLLDMASFALVLNLRKSVLNQGGKNLTVITIIVKYLWGHQSPPKARAKQFSLGGFEAV